MAAGVAGEGGAGGADAVLAGAISWGGGAGVADRWKTEKRGEGRGRTGSGECEAAVRRRAAEEVEGVEPEGWSDIVHDVAGRSAGVAGAVHGTEGHRGGE